MTRARMGIWVVLAGLIAVVAGAVALRSGGGSANGAPVALRLGATGATTTTGASADAALYPYYDLTYVAGAGLPALGGHAPVYTVARPDDAAVIRLAHTLGVDGTVAHDGGSQTVTDGTRQVSVYGVYWSLGSTDGMIVGSGTSSSGVACASADPAVPCPTIPPTTIPQRPDGFPTQADATARALAALDAAGFDTGGATVTTEDGTTVWLVTVTLQVGGHPAAGYAATFDIGPGPTIEYANGAIGPVSVLGDYPLIDTQAAIGRLNADGPFYGGGGREPMALATDSVASAAGAATPPGAGADGPATTIAEPDATPSSEPTADAPTVGPGAVDPPCDATAAGCTEPGAPPDSTVVPPDTAPGDTVPGDTVPGDTVPGDTVPTLPPPDAVTVTLDHTVLEFSLASSWDGTTVYVVPVYRFTGTDSDGNPADVIALTVDGSLLAGPDGGTVPPDREPGTPASGGSTGASGSTCPAVESGGGTTITVYGPACGTSTSAADPNGSGQPTGSSGSGSSGYPGSGYPDRTTATTGG